MDAATCPPSLHFCNSISLGKTGGRKQNEFLKISQKCEVGRLQTINSKALQSSKVLIRRPRRVNFELSCSYTNEKQASSLVSEKTRDSVDEPFILKKKALDVAPYINGRCLYLVGMMGSGKTTVGKILSEVLGYSFFDSDKLVEQAVGVTSVAQIFKQYSEGFFRDNESEVLREISVMRRLVVATGGGAVIRPINWKYMKQGITVWLDVPLEALARRIAAVGTASRPLLHQESGDPYTKALSRLSILSEERGEAYANADAKGQAIESDGWRLQKLLGDPLPDPESCPINSCDIAAKLGQGDVNDLTPTTIAVEVLLQIESFLKGEEIAAGTNL